MLSIIIPSRNEQFLTKTLKDILIKAEGEIEVIVILDGYWPAQDQIVNDSRINYIHNPEPIGMRSCINAGVAVSRGKYIMKLDAHCMLDQGFDVKLIGDCEPNWVSIPRRKRLDPENWVVTETHKPDIDYMYLSSPTDPNDWGGASLHGKVWDDLNLREDLKEVLIDDLMSFQGSCWFMHRDYFYELELMDDKNYGHFWNEAQEIGLKCWLSGGRVIRNKKTWYAHLHKGKKYGRGYFLSKSALDQGAQFTKKWIDGTAWPKATKDLKWLVDHFKNKFGSVPTWTDDTNKKEIKKDLTKPLSSIKKRGELAQYFFETGLNKGVEIGVADGRHSEYLCKMNPNIELFCVDPWDTYKENSRGGGQSQQHGNFEKAKARLAPYNAHLIRKFSMDAVKNFEDGSLDFVYIDGNHDFDYVMQDLIAWSKKVRPGGIIAGHDYYHFHNSGVIEAVDAYLKGHKIRNWYLTQEREPSFFWVKEDDGFFWVKH